MINTEQSKIDFTVVIPCANEEQFIVNMLNDVCTQTAFSKLNGEIIVVDGDSSDKTIEKINEVVSGQDLEIIIINNPERHVSPGLNKAIKQSKGDFIVRMDVHARYPADYIDTLLSYIKAHPECGNVGVPVKTLPAGTSSKAVAISVVLAHPFGVGNSTFRTGNISKPISVDTVPFGCFRASLFKEVGFFDLELIRNQDDELNNRIRLAGHEVVLIPEPVVKYFGRATYSKLWNMFYQYGLFKPLVAKKLGRVMTIRQLIPPVLVSSIFGALGVSLFVPIYITFLGLVLMCYCLAAILLARQAMSNLSKELRKTNRLSFDKLWLHCIAALLLVHFSYGLGYLKGGLSLIRNKKISVGTLSR